MLVKLDKSIITNRRYIRDKRIIRLTKMKINFEDPTYKKINIKVHYLTFQLSTNQVSINN